jgi:pimeloyl-ACP methyl ester carboxylesterase
MTGDSGVNRISRFTFAPDGLRLHYFEYGSKFDPGTPVVCLPGLARTADDFDRLARVLAAPATGQRRRILALDYRGRGSSAWDPDWTHYSLQTEHEDILTTLAAAEVTHAIFIGTSRGGLHVMALAATRPSLIRGAIINDIGPVIEPLGLMRIKSYVGNLPPLTSWKDAVDWLRKGASAHFTNVAETDWQTYARLTFSENGGQFQFRYDPALARTLETISADSPPPEFWPQFEALANVPVLGLRGENSDLLSPATFAEMGKRHPAFQALIVKGQGHPALLLDTPTILAIADFVGRIPRAGLSQD